MSSYLVIVESPAKARTIAKFLPREYVVESCVGHIRDLPDSSSEIPAEIKSKPWARIAVDVENDFKPYYVVSSDKKKKVQELKALLKKCDVLYLATDEDREGESISWHLFEVLQPKVETHRLVFHEITKKAILESLDHSRTIDLRLVEAQETRRILDRLFGYEVSPLLWKKIKSKLSAGRVQSVALLLVVQRERERMRFRSGEYWDLEATLAPLAAGKPKQQEKFPAQLVSLRAKRVASGRDFDPSTGKLKEGQSDAVLVSAEDAARLKKSLERGEFKVDSVERKPFTQRPPAPFTTSTLQQEGGRKLRLSAKVTMSLAQRLYENGYITYMRTDSTTLSDQALQAARAAVLQLYGKDYLPKSAREYRTKVKNAQEAHEAIRPAGEVFRTPAEVEGELSTQEFTIYEMIWKRTVASQMEDARGHRVTLRVSAGDAIFSASGKVIDFPGFLRAYVEGSDDPDAELAEQDRILPAVAVGDPLACLELAAREHHTQPPARLTEAALVKELERNGIGRPSTWAAVIDTILTRGYVSRIGGALVPHFVGFAVTNLLEKHFPKFVDLGFTARMEDDLDAISRGEAEGTPYLRQFYFGNGNPGLKTLLERGTADIDPRTVCSIPIGVDSGGREIVVRVGRYGPYLQRGEDTAPIPDGTLPDELSVEVAEGLIAKAQEGPKQLGTDPETGRVVYIRDGRFGPYVQLEAEGDDKPKNASLLPGMTPADVDLATALKLLSLPRSLGADAAGVEVLALNGRYGPYIQRGEDRRSLEATDHLFAVTLARALELLAQEKRGRGRGRSREPLAVLGKAKALGDAEIKLFDGRFGPYVTDGETNASLPRGADVTKFTLEDAVELIARRKVEGGGKKKRRTAKGAASKKPAAAKAGARKSPASKAAAPESAATTKPATKKAATKKAATKKTAKKSTTKKTSTRKGSGKGSTGKGSAAS